MGATPPPPHPPPPEVWEGFFPWLEGTTPCDQGAAPAGVLPGQRCVPTHTRAFPAAGGRTLPPLTHASGLHATGGSQISAAWAGGAGFAPSDGPPAPLSSADTLPPFSDDTNPRAGGRGRFPGDALTYTSTGKDDRDRGRMRTNSGCRGTLQGWSREAEPACLPKRELGASAVHTSLRHPRPCSCAVGKAIPV